MKYLIIEEQEAYAHIKRVMSDPHLNDASKMNIIHLTVQRLYNLKE